MTDTKLSFTSIMPSALADLTSSGCGLSADIRCVSPIIISFTTGGSQRYAQANNQIQIIVFVNFDQFSRFYY